MTSGGTVTRIEKTQQFFGIVTAALFELIKLNNPRTMV
jgi:hypothetical protein